MGEPTTEATVQFSTGGNIVAVVRCEHAVDLRFQRCFMCHPDTGALSVEQAERLFAVLDRIVRTLDKINMNLDTARMRR